MSNVENSKAIVSDTKDTIRNTFVEMANALSGCEGRKDDVGKLEEIEMLFRLEGDFESNQKECGNSENLKNVADLGKGER